MSDQPIEGTVRCGPPPTDAVRPEAVVYAEDGTVAQAVIHLPDGTAVEVTMPDIDPEAFAFRAPSSGVDLMTRWRMRYGLVAPCLDPKQLMRITGM